MVGAVGMVAMHGVINDDMVGKLVVAIVPSFAERYLSTALFEGL